MGRVVAYLPVTVLFVFLAIGPLWIVMNGIVAHVTGITPNMPEAPGVSVLEQWAGTYPYPIPVWVYVVVMLLLPAVLAVVWKFADQAPTGASLMAISGVSMFCAGFAFHTGLYFPQADGSYGLHWIAGLIGVATVIAAAVRTHQTRALPPKRRRKRPAARPTAA